MTGMPRKKRTRPEPTTEPVPASVPVVVDESDPVVVDESDLALVSGTNILYLFDEASDVDVPRLRPRLRPRSARPLPKKAKS